MTGLVPMPLTHDSMTASARRSKRSAWILNALYILTFATIVVLVTIPLGALVYGSFRSSAPGVPGDWTLQNYAGLASPGVLRSLGTTLWISILSSAFCVVIGTLIAIIVHRTDFKYTRTVTALLGVSFYFPSFILAMSWIIIGSPGGILNSFLKMFVDPSTFRINIYSITGIIFVMVLNQVPFVYLTMRGPILSMDGIFEEAARTAGARPYQVLLRVTLPLLAYSIISSLILTFILNIEQFAIPAMIGIPGNISVLATQLYLFVRFAPVDYGLAAALGLTLSILTGAAIWAQRRVTRLGRLTTVTGKAGRAAPIRLKYWKWPAYILCFGVIALALILPIIILLYTSVLKWFVSNPLLANYTLRNYVFMWESASAMRSFWNTLIVSGVGAAIGVTLGLLSGYFTLRLRPPGHTALDFVASLPFGMPGIVMGLGLLWAYAYLPLPVYGTLTIIIIAFVTRFLPYAIETIGGQLVQIDKSLEEAAWVGGASRVAAIQRILVPLVTPSLQGAYFLLFMAFFREISSAVLLYTGSTQVISISIWAYFEQANWGLASSMSVVATIIIFATMSLILWLMPAARRA
ncbi:ABC transporter permease [Pseudochelatococcus sp. B33]